MSDPANPENEGKVFLYRYGQKIFEMIQDVIKPTVPSEDPINPFDPWEGVDFALVARNVAGYRNYDKSKFGSKVRPIADSDEAIDELWAQQYSLNEIVDPSQFKSYDELKAKLEMVLKGSVAAVAPASAQTGDVEDDIFINESTATPEVSADSGDDEDAMSYFSRLADD